MVKVFGNIQRQIKVACILNQGIKKVTIPKNRRMLPRYVFQEEAFCLILREF